MKYAIRNHAALICVAASLLAMSSAARAEYKCDAPASIDRRACQAAKESPQALRLFVQRMKAIDALYFFDYVNEAQALAWDQNKQSSKVAQQPSAQSVELYVEQPGS